MPDPVDIFVLCRCRYGQFAPPPEALEAVRADLVSRGTPWVEVDDLCELAEQRHPLLRRVAGASRPAIIACFPRAVRGLFQFAGAELGPGARLLNLRALGPAGVLADLAQANPAGQLGQAPQHVPSPGDWTPWFPVIDPGLCVACGQCQNFCLFGVYEQDDRGQVRVAQPRHCKTHCPACARVCPQGAIVFPKYKDGPIAGDAQAGQEKVDLGTLIGPDAYAALRQRGAKRFPTEQEIQESVQKAIQERMRCAKPPKPPT